MSPDTQPMWTAWVDSTTDRARVHAELEQLVGRSVVGCRYIEIDYEGGQLGWPQPGRDELDYGLELDLDDGQTWSICWEQGFEREGLGVWRGPLIGQRVVKAAVREVTDRWLTLGPVAIGAIRLGWEQAQLRQGFDLRELDLIGTDGRVAALRVHLDEVHVHFSEPAARHDPPA